MPHNFDLELFPAFIAYKCLVPQIRSPISLRIILTFSNPMVNNQTMFSSVDLPLWLLALFDLTNMVWSRTSSTSANRLLFKLSSKIIPMLNFYIKLILKA